ncbi:5-methylcytosine-specific restriction endonuclease system specificity protein McrC [Aeromonas veronii]|uniref:5-methylcytosine-specific restriction endonuclease system specificity protein McrC n=1 Tax=Aeromonas veronii TaxID=654 RepID=UPI00226D0A7D|nr:5-methylcytosine-specific restriction endonuclease system specificity protein McrC [Aeromonas veronii]MCX9114757.1 5-methylcytosine-specific restriction endonuclease system specificity protein McrC [Aeromonas veronii]
MTPEVANLMSDAEEEIGRIGSIPVRNLWLLMLYASDLFRDIEKTKVAVEDNPDDIPDLVAEILCRRVERRIRRNLSYGYQSREAVLGRVRGRIDQLNTERRRLLDRGKVACRFDELTIDTTRNCFVRAALEEISKVVRRRSLAHRCRSLAASLKRMGVIGERPNRSEVSMDRFGRLDADDKPMLAAAHLAFNIALPTEATGAKQLSLPDREITWIRKLYEKGIAGFYDVVLSKSGWRVDAGKTMSWQIERKTLGIDKILPTMRTDIILDHSDAGHRIVIDTKFNSVVKRGWYREETLRSGYLYQIYAYLRSQEGKGDPLAQNASGLLLHPSVGYMVNEAVVIQNHEIRFATVDLGSSAREIREQLLQVLAFPPEYYSTESHLENKTGKDSL